MNVRMADEGLSSSGAYSDVQAHLTQAPRQKKRRKRRKVARDDSTDDDQAGSFIYVSNTNH